MSKQVQIDFELFVKLLQYFSEDEKSDWLSDEIKHELSEKTDKIINRQLFTKYKRAATPDEREEYRKKYLENRGILQDFITDEELKYQDM